MTILAGKKYIIPTWHLHLTLEPRFVLDLDFEKMFPASELKQYTLIDSFQNLTASISYDQEKLSSHRFDNASNFLLEKHLADDSKSIEHELLVTIEGMEVNNNFNIGNQIVTVGVFMKMHIDGVECDWYLDNQPCFYCANGEVKTGMLFLCENGTQVIKLHTPIYTWLFENENLIIKKFSKLKTKKFKADHDNSRRKF